MYIDKPTQFRSVAVPDQSMYLSESYTKEYLVPFETIKANVTPANVKKIYLSRLEYDTANKDKRKCFGEEYFEKFFVAHGFKSIAPEKLSVTEQIALVMGADEIAAGMGTLTHFAFFCKPGAKFIQLNRTSTYHSTQSFVNDATKVDAYVINCSKNFLYANHWDSYLLYSATDCWKEFVADYFGEQIIESDANEYFDDALANYLDYWFRKYADNHDLCVKYVKKLCNSIVALEKEVSCKRPLLTYIAHVAKDGWKSDWKTENHLSNSIEFKYDIQAVKIDFTDPLCNLYYAVYYTKEGWTQEVSNGQMAGTTGKSKPIFGIKIRLDEVGEKDFDILYRVHKFDGTWSDWAKNGAELISDQKLNALQIKLEAKQTFTIDISKPDKFITNRC